MAEPGDDEELEFTLFNKRDSMVYQIPPASSSSGHKADDWKKCIWRGRCRIVGKGKDMSIKLEDGSSGQLFANCQIPNGEHSKYVERVTDSSRYFVLKITNGDRHAFIGLGFEDRNDAFDFNCALSDFKQASVAPATPEIAGPGKDLSLKEGQKISINLENLNLKKRATPAKGNSAGGMLAPPPGGGLSMLAPPPPAGGQSRRQPAGAGYAAPAASPAPFAAPAAGAPKAGNTDDFFADFGDSDFQSAGFSDFQSAGFADFQTSAPAPAAAAASAPSTDFVAAFDGLAFGAAPAPAPAASVLGGLTFDAAPAPAPAAAGLNGLSFAATPVAAPAVALAAAPASAPAAAAPAEPFDPFTAAFGDAAAALPTSSGKQASTPGQRPGQKDPFDAFDIFK